MNLKQKALHITTFLKSTDGGATWSNPAGQTFAFEQNPPMVILARWRQAAAPLPKARTAFADRLSGQT